ncbi:C40 family peptidase [Anaeromicropila populeti]|uniref:SH3 domain-containing protein n=1 Tax=Anaeromicropila populeti TaxID=37658 RepID=A0A1I6L7J2_9FIRM|nr:SH3 domain-containing C40 family peptidase [Anaeromicropila populeti]SFR99429.1 SH3 domain-containing protein [Anaeromicropila populeti]
MKKHLWMIGVAGLTGITLLAISNLNASVISTEIPMAGIELSLDKYYTADPLSSPTPAEEDSTDVIENTESTDNTVVVPDVEAEEAAQEEEETTEEEVDIKSLISNMNYDRLGIAKVDNYLNIRQKPSMDAKIIGKLPKDAGCHIYSIKNGWAKIVSGKVTGYVSSEFLVTDEEAEQYALEVGTLVATVNTETLNARFLPSVDSSIYTLVPVEEDLEVVKEDLSKKYITSFIEKHFSGEDEKYIENVDQSDMNKQLEDWVCVTIDNEKVFVAKEFVTISYQLKKAVFVEELAEDGSSGVSSLRARMVQFAKQYLGNRYVYGGTSLTGGIDCSGFMMRIYQNFGYSIPRTSAAQSSYARTISASEAKPGDLFFYGNGSRVSHVAMYIGNGQVIHASNPKSGIKISNAYYRTPMKVGRIIND